MKFIKFLEQDFFFSGKKFLGFVNEDKESGSESPDPDGKKEDSEKVDSTQKNTKEKIQQLLEKAEQNQKVINDLRAQLEAEEQKNPEKSTNDSSEEDVVDDHNAIREHGDLEDLEPINSEENDYSPYTAYKSREKHNLDTYKKHNDDLEEYLYSVNDLKKQNEILGAAGKNIRQFKGESGLINELRFRSIGKFEVTKEKITAFAAKFDEFQNRFQALVDEPNDQVWQEKNAILVNELIDHVNSWKRSVGSLSITEEILGTKNELKRLVYDLVPDSRSADNFVHKYFEELDLFEDALSKKLNEFLAVLQERNFDLSGTEKFWDSLPKYILKINRYIDFNDGVLKDDSVKAEQQLDLQKEGLDFLKENDFFEEGEYVFAQKVAEMQGDIASNIKSYSKKFHKTRVKIYKDIDKLDDNDFFDKYSFSKEKIIENLEAHAQQIEAFENEIKEWGGSRFMNEWLEKYNESDESRAEALLEIGDFVKYKNGIEDIKKYDEGLEQFLDNSTRITTYSYSLYDMYQMFKRYFEKRKRLWERRSERAVANLGVEVFGDDTPIGKEFVKESEDEEHKRVDEFETQKASLYGWDVRADLYKTSDPDEAKACINLLIKNGFMKWDDPEFWWTLNRLEGFNRFVPSDIELSTPQILNKVKEACSSIWSDNDFNGWQTSLKSSAVSAQDAFAGEFESFQSMDSAAPAKILAGMLQKWNSVPRQSEGVDPAKYESFLRCAFDQGRMNGGPQHDQRWWYLIHGVASGLLSRDAFIRLNGEFLGGSPLLDFFTDGGWKKNGKPVPEGTPGAEQRQWEYRDFKAWAEVLGDANGLYNPNQVEDPIVARDAKKRRERFFYDYVFESEAAVGRVERMVRGGTKNFDHDDMGLYSALLGASEVRGMIGTESQGAEKLTKDGWRNYLDEFDNYFKNEYRKIQEGDREYGLNNSFWIKRRAFILNRVANRLRTGYGAAQTLLGNYNMSELARKRNTTFTEEDWNKESAFSVNANAAKDKIFTMMGFVLDNSKASSSNKQEFNRLTSVTLSNVSDDDFKPADKFNAQLVRGDLGNTIINGDPDAVFKALEQYCNGA